MRFGITRNELNSLAANLDRLAAHAERQISGHSIDRCAFLRRTGI
jgi:hypothetical protein